MIREDGKFFALGYLIKETPDVTNYSFAGYQLPFTGNLITQFRTATPMEDSLLHGVPAR